MARQVTVTITCADAQLAPGIDFHQVSLTQSLFDHHALTLVVPFDSVEGPATAFFSQASQRLLGQSVSVVVQADDAFHFNSIAQECRFKGVITDLGTSKDSDYVGSITIQAFSPCYMLDDGRQKRTFVNQTLTAIFQQVLAPYPTNLLPRRIQPTHQMPLPYAVQYDESNYAFLSRLASEYAEWFYYDGQTLQLGSPQGRREIDFVADGEYNSFHFGLSLRPTKATLYDYNYQRHEHFTADTSRQQIPAISQHPYGKLALAQSEKLFAQPARVSSETLIEGTRQLDEEAQALKAHSVTSLVTLQGHSDNPSLQLGGILSVSGEGLGSRHITPDSFGKYRVTELTHHVDARGNYRNSFTAIPHLLDVPPPNPHHAPPIGTPELAEVIDEKDPYKLGRVRVRYHWNVQQREEAESNWLRVLTPYSGLGKGQLFNPEVGSQVLVGYESSLAEQPVVLGNMFHANNPQQASYSPASNGTKGIQTAGGNKFVMLEAQGAQQILISNSNKKGTAIRLDFKGDGSVDITTNGPINLTSGDTITLDAKKNIALRAGEDITLAAQKNILLEAQEEDVAVQAQKEVLLVAIDGDLTLAATNKKVVVRAANDIEVAATGTAKIVASDIKWSKS